MKRRMVIGLAILAGTMQLTFAQSTNRASQVVTFSVHLTHHQAIDGFENAALPADAKVTATIEPSSAHASSNAINLASVERLTGNDRDEVAGDSRSNENSRADESSQAADKAVLFTVTQ